jgi:hypothetical protein
MFRAKLDSNGMFLGLEEVAELLDSDIELGEDCGLKPGKYRWDGTTFLPLPKSQQKLSEEYPSLEAAFYSLLQSQVTLTADCEKWIEGYKKSFDAIGKNL